MDLIMFENKLQEIIPLKTARKIGIIKYFTGIPCKEGHLSDIDGSNPNDIIAKKNPQYVPVDDEVERVAKSIESIVARHIMAAIADYYMIDYNKVFLDAAKSAIAAMNTVKPESKVDDKKQEYVEGWVRMRGKNDEFGECGTLVQVKLPIAD